MCEFVVTTEIQLWTIAERRCHGWRSASNGSLAKTPIIWSYSACVIIPCAAFPSKFPWKNQWQQGRAHRLFVPRLVIPNNNTESNGRKKNKKTGVGTEWCTCKSGSLALHTSVLPRCDQVAGRKSSQIFEGGYRSTPPSGSMDAEGRHNIAICACSSAEMVRTSFSSSITFLSGVTRRHRH